MEIKRSISSGSFTDWMKDGGGGDYKEGDSMWFQTVSNKVYLDDLLRSSDCYGRYKNKSFAGRMYAGPDPRVPYNQKHKFLDIIMIAVIAILYGMDTWNEIEDWARSTPAFVFFTPISHQPHTDFTAFS